jgi:hypothetical protein
MRELESTMSHEPTDRPEGMKAECSARKLVGTEGSLI